LENNTEAFWINTQMRIIIDKRERDLIEKCGTMNIPVESAVLPIGDILVKTDENADVFIVERKTLADLLASIKDGRYQEQSHRLIHSSGFHTHNILYIIEGVYSTLRDPNDKKKIMAAIASMQFFKGFSVMRTSSVNETAELLFFMTEKVGRNFQEKKQFAFSLVPNSKPLYENLQRDPSETNTPYSGFVKKVKKENITPENMGEIMLLQIPRISAKYAGSLLAHFGGFSKMMAAVKHPDADMDALFKDIFYEDSNKKMRRVPKTCGEEIVRYLRGV